MTVVILATIITTAFIPSAKPKTTSFKYVGDIPPVNYFDPLKINSENNYKEERVKYWREAELQHGRTAMLGAVVLPLIELTKPGTMSIDYLSNLDNMMQSPFWLSMFVYECVRMSNGWVNPFVKNGKLFTLKDDYQPGNLFAYNSANVSERLYNNELSHGRLAMLTCAHIIGYELLTKNSIF